MKKLILLCFVLASCSAKKPQKHEHLNNILSKSDSAILSNDKRSKELHEETDKALKLVIDNYDSLKRRLKESQDSNKIVKIKIKTVYKIDTIYSLR